MKKVDIPAWPILSKLKNLFELLNQHGESRLVGGCVRDLILGNVPQDIDIATTVHPEVILETLKKHNIKAIPTGIKHGTVTAILDKEGVEITTLRKDIECFGRQAKVEFTDDWYEDALRRDFTINAMYMKLDGTLYDYFSGEEDLCKRVVKFIGNPEERINEDVLRILRFFRFYAYFGGNELDSKSLNAIVKNAYKTDHLSGERIRKEILKMLEKPYALQAFNLMLDTGVWRYITPDLEIAPAVYNYNFCEDSIINIAAIINITHDTISAIEKIRLRWRLSNKETNMLKILCSNISSFDIQDTRSAKRALYFLGKENFIKVLKLKSVLAPALDYKKLYDMAENLVIPSFPIKGHDIKKLGITNKAIGDMILYATNAWINSDFRLKKEELLETIKSCYFKGS